MRRYAVKGYEDKYEITEDGRVWNKYKKKWLVVSNVGGYAALTLILNKDKTQYKLHRLLAQHFIPNPSNRSQVNHINGIKNDNRLSNLEWTTPLENMEHAVETGLVKGGLTKVVKNKLLTRVLDGESIDDLLKETTIPHRSSLQRMLRVFAIRQGKEEAWTAEMKRRRYQTWCKNIEKANAATAISGQARENARAASRRNIHIARAEYMRRYGKNQ